jgi:hypothetical protein
MFVSAVSERFRSFAPNFLWQWADAGGHIFRRHDDDEDLPKRRRLLDALEQLVPRHHRLPAVVGLWRRGRRPRRWSGSDVAIAETDGTNVVAIGPKMRRRRPSGSRTPSPLARPPRERRCHSFLVERRRRSSASGRHRCWPQDHRRSHARGNRRRR